MSWISSYLFGSPTLSETRNRWISVLIIFSDEGNLVLDKGYVFLGNLPIYYLGNYCNLTNFIVIDNQLYYFYKNGTVKQIDPKNVHLHIKFGEAPYEIELKNNFWNLFFSTTDNRIYKRIKNFLDESHIKLINLEKLFSSKRRLKANNIEHPLFKKKQIYGIGMDQVLFSELNIELL